jgi:small conductance mechanosensitive channel
MEKLDYYYQKAADYLMEVGPNILLSLLTLVIGWIIINWLTRLLKRGFYKSKLDPTLVPFLSNMFNWGLKVLLFISVASMIGIATTSFIAVLGAAGLAIGLALQGTLANFAGGVIILIFRPYKVGDLIEAQGYLGVVEEIQIFVTKLSSPQNEAIILPNGAISNGSIKNYTQLGMRRVDIVIGISYSSDIKKARDVLVELMKSHEKILKDPEPMVVVLELADSSVNLGVRPWVHPDNYWDVFFEITENGKRVLEENGITIPFPQRDVHLFSEKAG